MLGYKNRKFSVSACRAQVAAKIRAVTRRIGIFFTYENSNREKMAVHGGRCSFEATKQREATAQRQPTTNTRVLELLRAASIVISVQNMDTDKALSGG